MVTMFNTWLQLHYKNEINEAVIFLSVFADIALIGGIIELVK